MILETLSWSEETVMYSSPTYCPFSSPSLFSIILVVSRPLLAQGFSPFLSLVIPQSSINELKCVICQGTIWNPFA